MLDIAEESYTAGNNSLDFLQLLNNDTLHLDLEVIDIYGSTVLQRRAEEGSAEEIKALLDLGCIPNDGPLCLGDGGDTTIHYSIFSGNYETFSVLLEPHFRKFPNIDQEDENGWTMLSLAAYHGHDKIVRRLLELGADEFYPNGEYVPDLSEIQGIVSGDEEKQTQEQQGKSWNCSSYNAYMKALMDYGRINVSADPFEEGEKREIFWATDPVQVE